MRRHREGPAADARQRYLTHCADQGMARGTLLRTAREVLAIAERIDLTTDKAISVQNIEAAADRWITYQQRRCRIRGSALGGSRELFIQKALSWLRFLGRLERPSNKVVPSADLIEDFATYMREQRGLSEITICGRCWHVEKLLEWLDGKNLSFGKISIRDLDAFLISKAAGGWNRVSVLARSQFSELAKNAGATQGNMSM